MYFRLPKVKPGLCLHAGDGELLVSFPNSSKVHHLVPGVYCVLAMCQQGLTYEEAILRMELLRNHPRVEAAAWLERSLACLQELQCLEAA